MNNEFKSNVAVMVVNAQNEQVFNGKKYTIFSLTGEPDLIEVDGEKVCGLADLYSAEEIQDYANRLKNQIVAEFKLDGTTTRKVNNTNRFLNSMGYYVDRYLCRVANYIIRIEVKTKNEKVAYVSATMESK